MLLILFQVYGRRIHVNYFIGIQNRPVAEVRILGRLGGAGNVIEKGTPKKIKNNFLDKFQMKDSGRMRTKKNRRPCGHAA